MNKQELIERIEGLKNLFGNKAEYVEIDTVIELVSKLHEPQEPIVPQFVADWYEEHKDDFEFNIWDYVFMFNNKDESDFTRWLNDSKINSFQTLVNMHQFGYTVEKEKRYTVKIKGELEENLLVYGLGVKKYFFTRYYDSSKKGKHTRKELEKARLGDVFNSPLFEVEEVEV